MTVSTRRYESPARREQAERTRETILTTSEQLFARQGFSETTISEIAEGAGCSAARIYALFKSKAGILLASVAGSTFGPAYEKAVAELQEAEDPAAILRLVAHIARLIYEGERDAFGLLSGGGLVSDELADRNREIEAQRHRLHEPVIGRIASAGALAKGVPKAAAQDRLRVLTGRDLFRGLTVESGWSADAYETWLGDLLVIDLLEPDRRSRSQADP